MKVTGATSDFELAVELRRRGVNVKGEKSMQRIRAGTGPGYERTVELLLIAGWLQRDDQKQASIRASSESNARLVKHLEDLLGEMRRRLP